MNSDELKEAIQAVSHYLVADVPLGTTLERIAELARDNLGAAVACGLTLLDERARPSTAVFTDELSPAVDQGQYDAGAGPCLDAYRTRRVVRVDDTAAVADRWPDFSRAAADHGVRSTLSFPMTAGNEPLGALNLYAATTNGFDDTDEAGGTVFATQAAVVLSNARAYWDAYDLGAGLSQAMQRRSDIEMAKGKVMAANACGPERAFDLLILAAQRENVTLREIARRIVQGRHPPEVG